MFPYAGVLLAGFHVRPWKEENSVPEVSWWSSLGPAEREIGREKNKIKESKAKIVKTVSSYLAMPVEKSSHQLPR